jgi:predicted secreted hydrolase
MLYQIRHTDGAVDPFSSGTIVRADGSTEHLTVEDFEVKVLSHWKSKQSGGRYPMGWHITLPRHEISLSVTPSLQQQELNTKESTRISYWEGSCKVAGTYEGRAVRGMGYTELTGYVQPLGSPPEKDG